MSISFDKVSLFKLAADTQINDFDCGDDDLNDYFVNHAKNFSKQLLAVTYVIKSDNDVVAFFSIFNDKISIREIKNPNKWEAFKSIFPDEKRIIPSFPAVKIGRLAVNNKYKGQGLGTLIIDYLIDNFINSNKTGCRFITVDAYSKSLDFYKKAGFNFLTENDANKDTRLMYLDLYPYLNSQLS